MSQFLIDPAHLPGWVYQDEAGDLYCALHAPAKSRLCSVAEIASWRSTDLHCDFCGDGFGTPNSRVSRDA